MTTVLRLDGCEWEPLPLGKQVSQCALRLVFQPVNYSLSLPLYEPGYSLTQLLFG